MYRLHLLVQLADSLVLRLAFVPALATRLVLGYGFYLTGSGKLLHLDNLVRYFHELGIPFAELQAPFVATLEFVGGMALLAGLMTRFFAFGLAGTMAVALLTADKMRFLESWSRDSDLVPTDVTSFAYLILLAWLAVYGGGALSLDAAVRRLSTREEPPVRSVAA